MRAIVSSEKLPVTKVTVESEGRSDTLFAYGVECPAVMGALRMSFGQSEEGMPVNHVRKKRRTKKAIKAG